MERNGRHILLPTRDWRGLFVREIPWALQKALTESRVHDERKIPCYAHTFTDYLGDIPRVLRTPRDKSVGQPPNAVMYIGPYCTLPGHVGAAVEPTGACINAIVLNTIGVAGDSISFEVIIWDDREALVVAKHGQIFSDIWVAIIDPATIPSMGE